MERVEHGLRIAQIRQKAFEHGWQVERFDIGHRLIRFKKTIEGMGQVLLDVWYSTMTVGTTLNHPLKGRNTLFREHVSPSLLIAILRNPRLHTWGKGYRRKYGFR